MTTRTAFGRTIEDIAAALASVSRVLNQVKVHETLCKGAGVDLDRAGAALVYKLYTEGDNVRLTDLAERLAIDSPAVTRKVQQLERDGLVCRSTDPDDARALRLKLTRQGRLTIEKLLHARQHWLDDVLQGWPEADRRQLARVLQLLASSIESHGEPANGS